MKTAALLLASMLASPAFPAALQLPPDGWASWEVLAVEGAPAWCCNGRACKLDGGRDGYSVRDHGTTDAVKVYARLSGGQVDSLQVYAASCPVEAKTPIHELGGVAVDDSARWLIERVRLDGTDGVARRSLAESALAALAMHRGDLARDSMAGFARTDARAGTRKWALFWLALSRGSESDSQGVISESLRKDPENDVREQAVFALSRLPDERATKALITAAEDRSLPRELRKRAVFWLSQSESDSAQAFLEKVLLKNAAR